MGSSLLTLLVNSDYSIDTLSFFDETRFYPRNNNRYFLTAYSTYLHGILTEITWQCSNGQPSLNLTPMGHLRDNIGRRLSQVPQQQTICQLEAALLRDQKIMLYSAIHMTSHVVVQFSIIGAGSSIHHGLNERQTHLQLGNAAAHKWIIYYGKIEVSTLVKRLSIRNQESGSYLSCEYHIIILTRLLNSLSAWFGVKNHCPRAMPAVCAVQMMCCADFPWLCFWKTSFAIHDEDSHTTLNNS